MASTEPGSPQCRLQPLETTSTPLPGAVAKVILPHEVPEKQAVPGGARRLLWPPARVPECPGSMAVCERAWVRADTGQSIENAVAVLRVET